MAQTARIGSIEKARRLMRRYGIGGKKAAAGALVALCAALACIGVRFSGSGAGGVEVELPAVLDSASDEAPAPAEAAEPAATILVHVDGAVAAPGVYGLEEGSRVNDAVVAAGGLAEGADTSGINLAAPVVDGSKVHIPSQGEAQAQAAAAAESGGAAGAASGLVNINTATVEELQALSGVGASTAAAIVEDREANGPFTSPEDLMRVSGIGEKKFAKLKSHVCV